jgi:hypothetical protein
VAVEQEQVHQVEVLRAQLEVIHQFFQILLQVVVLAEQMVQVVEEQEVQEADQDQQLQTNQDFQVQLPQVIHHQYPHLKEITEVLLI